MLSSPLEAFESIRSQTFSWSGVSQTEWFPEWELLQKAINIIANIIFKQLICFDHCYTDNVACHMPLRQCNEMRQYKAILYGRCTLPMEEVVFPGTRWLETRWPVEIAFDKIEDKVHGTSREEKINVDHLRGLTNSIWWIYSCFSFYRLNIVYRLANFDAWWL